MCGCLCFSLHLVTFTNLHIAHEKNKPTLYINGCLIKMVQTNADALFRKIKSLFSMSINEYVLVYEIMV